MQFISNGIKTMQFTSNEIKSELGGESNWEIFSFRFGRAWVPAVSDMLFRKEGTPFCLAEVELFDRL